MSAADCSIARVRSEYRETPGLRLTLAQASRLWHIERHVCAELLDALVEEGFLERTDEGLFTMPPLQKRTGQGRDR